MMHNVQHPFHYPLLKHTHTSSRKAISISNIIEAQCTTFFPVPIKDETEKNPYLHYMHKYDTHTHTVKKLLAYQYLTVLQPAHCFLVGKPHTAHEPSAAPATAAAIMSLFRQSGGNSAALELELESTTKDLDAVSQRK